jgi:hypothetical protein
MKARTGNDGTRSHFAPLSAARPPAPRRSGGVERGALALLYPEVRELARAGGDLTGDDWLRPSASAGWPTPQWASPRSPCCCLTRQQRLPALAGDTEAADEWAA